MSNSSITPLELLAEAGAYKFTGVFLMKCLSAVVGPMAEPARSLTIEAILEQFKARRGEWLFSAPIELTPDQQAVFNSTMQRTLASVQEELVQRLNLPLPEQ